MKNSIKRLLSGVLALAMLGAPCVSAAQTNQASLLNAAENGSESTSLLANLELPEKFQGEWTGLDGSFLVSADAEIVLPEVGQIATASVSRREFTQEDVDKFISVFTKGNTLYEYQGTTKQSAQAYLEKLYAVQRGEIPLTDVTVDHTMDELPEMIAKWEELARTAPDESERNVASTTIQPDENGSWNISGVAEVDGKEMSVYIFSDADGWQITRVNYEEPEEADNSYIATETTTTSYTAPEATSTLEEFVLETDFTEDQAMETAEALLQELGLDDMVCDISVPYVLYREGENGEATDAKPAYQLYYAREINGVTVSYEYFCQIEADGTTHFMPSMSGTSVPDDETSENLWGMEWLVITVAEDGIRSFDWEFPYTTPVVETEDTQLLNFQDVSDIFAKMIFVVNSYHQTVNEKSGFVTIENVEVGKVELTLMRVRDKDNYSEGLIVPVWEFWGKTHMYTDDEANKNLVYDGSYYEIVLTINAIDGTVVDRGLGY